MNIAEFQRMLEAKGFFVSYSNLQDKIRKGMVTGFYRNTIYSHNKQEVDMKTYWCIDEEDANKFIKTFDYFGKGKPSKKGMVRTKR